MSVVLDARPLHKAVVAAVSANLGPWLAYDWNGVPGSKFGPEGILPDQYALISVSRRNNDAAFRQSGNVGITGWRVTVGASGRSPDECRWIMGRVASALHERPLTILSAGADDPVTTGLLNEGTDREPERDDEGRYFGTSSWTCSL